MPYQVENPMVIDWWWKNLEKYDEEEIREYVTPRKALYGRKREAYGQEVEQK